MNNPYRSNIAKQNSNYYRVNNGKLVNSDEKTWQSLPAEEIHTELRNFVKQQGFPCLGATSAFNSESYRFGVYDELAAEAATLGICRDLTTYLEDVKDSTSKFNTFLAVFKNPVSMSEEEFEKLLWEQLSLLAERDNSQNKWDENVSQDPEDPMFSYSFGGTAFYIIGLHPNSSRPARRSKNPMIVFNLHSQFEALRNSGKYNKMRDTIGERDMKFSGSVNPMLADFGKDSEAKQYSGRAVDESWKCPFHSK